MSVKELNDFDAIYEAINVSTKISSKLKLYNLES